MLKYDDDSEAGCHIGIDGDVIPQEDMFGSGNLFNYGTKQNWVWMLTAQRQIPEGDHIFSIYAKHSRLRIDRIYLSTNETYPPTDAQWDMP